MLNSVFNTRALRAGRSLSPQITLAPEDNLKLTYPLSVALAETTCERTLSSSAPIAVVIDCTCTELILPLDSITAKPAD